MVNIPNSKNRRSIVEQSKAESIASRLKAAWNAHDVKEFEDLSPVLVAVHSDENESHFGAL
jgi:hypothetical protein